MDVWVWALRLTFKLQPAFRRQQDTKCLLETFFEYVDGYKILLLLIVNTISEHVDPVYEKMLQLQLFVLGSYSQWHYYYIIIIIMTVGPQITTLYMRRRTTFIIALSIRKDLRTKHSNKFGKRNFWAHWLFFSFGLDSHAPSSVCLCK